VLDVGKYGAPSANALGRELKAHQILRGAKMEHGKGDMADLCPTTASVVNDGDKQQPVHRRLVGLTITVEKLDHVLADIDAQIEMLQRERTSLGLVRGELARMEARWSSA
jgi:hypothetical protein